MVNSYFILSGVAFAIIVFILYYLYFHQKKSAHGILKIERKDTSCNLNIPKGTVFSDGEKEYQTTRDCNIKSGKKSKNLNVSEVKNIGTKYYFYSADERMNKNIFSDPTKELICGTEKELEEFLSNSWGKDYFDFEDGLVSDCPPNKLIRGRIPEGYRYIAQGDYVSYYDYDRERFNWNFA